jgi:hypothetical protein
MNFTPGLPAASRPKITAACERDSRRQVNPADHQKLVMPAHEGGGEAQYYLLFGEHDE